MPLLLENPNLLTEWVGREIGVTDWLTLTQGLIRQFAEVTGDRQWIHVDQDRAPRALRFKRPLRMDF